MYGRAHETHSTAELLSLLRRLGKGGEGGGEQDGVQRSTADRGVRAQQKLDLSNDEHSQPVNFRSLVYMYSIYLFFINKNEILRFTI